MQSHSSSASSSTISVSCPDLHDYLQRKTAATELVKRKDYQNALQAFDELIQIYEDDIEVRFERIKLLTDMENYKLALDEGLNLLNLYLPNAALLGMCSTLCIKLIALEKSKATPDLEMITALQAQSKSFLSSALIARVENKKKEGTLKYEYAHLFNRHYILADTSQLESTYPQLANKAALVQYAQNPSEQLVLAYLLIIEKKHAQAAFLLTQILTQHPYDFIALAYRCAAFLDLQQPTLALKDAENCLSIRPYSMAYRYRAELYFIKGFYEKARADIITALLFTPLDNYCLKKMDPFRETALRLLATSLNRKIEANQSSERFKSLQKLDEAIVEDPLSHIIYATIGNMYFADKQLTLARLNYSLALWAAEGDEAFDYHQSRALTCLHDGALDAAIFDIENACQLRPHLALQIRDEFAISCHKTAKRFFMLKPPITDLVLEYLNFTKKMRPEDSSIDVDLAFVHTETGCFPLALSHALYAVNKNPADKNLKKLVKHIRAKMTHTPSPIALEFKKLLDIDDLPVMDKAPTKTKSSPLSHHTPAVFSLGTTKKKKHTKKISSALAIKNTLLQKINKQKEHAIIRKAILAQQSPTAASNTSDVNIPTNSQEAIEDLAVKAFEEAEKNKKEQADKLRRVAVKQKEKDKKLEKRLARKSSSSKEADENKIAVPPLAEPETSECPILQTYPENALAPTGIKIALPPCAQEVLEKMKQSHHLSLVVGGLARDTILEHQATFQINEQTQQYYGPNKVIFCTNKSADIDIVTTLSEEELRAIFPMGLEKISTVKHLFRLMVNNEKIDIYLSNALKIGLAEDSLLRDFTCNTLYVDAEGDVYDPTLRAIIDILNKRLDTIINPAPSLREDSIRILRAIYFASKCHFTLSESLQTHITKKKMLLHNQETGKLNVWFKKLLLHTFAEENFALLNTLGVFQELFPSLSKALKDEQPAILTLLHETDAITHPSLAKIYRSLIAIAMPHLKGITEETLIRQNRLLKQELDRQLAFYNFFRSPPTQGFAQQSAAAASAPPLQQGPI